MLIGVIVLLIDLFLIKFKIINVKDTIPEEKVQITGKIILCDYNYTSDIYTLKINKHKILVYDTLGKNNIKIGNIIKVKGEYHKYKKPTNIGEFNSYNYHISKKEIGYIYADEIIVLKNNSNRLLNKINEYRNRWLSNIDILFNKRESGIIKSIILGEKDFLNKDIKNKYKEIGISHILAISGLHISLLGLAIYSSLKKFITRGLLRVIFAAVIMGGYVYICSFGISSLRAYIMFLIFIIGDYLGRGADSLNSLGLSGLILIFLNPFCVLSQSFVFSFGSVCLLGIINILKIKSFGKMCLFQIGLIPIMASFNYIYPLYSLFVNMIVLPLFSILLFSSILSIGLIDLLYSLSRIFAGLSSFIIFIYDKICEVVAGLPFSSVTLGRQGKISILFYYLIYFFIIYYLKNKENKSDYHKESDSKNWSYYITYYIIRIRHFFICSKK